MLTETEFEQVLQTLTKALSRGDLEQAVIEKDHVLSEGTPAMKGQYLLYLGLTRERSGDLSGGQRDWLDALAFASPRTFLRYSLEENLGRVCRKLFKPGEAQMWYRQALRTCSDGDEFSGNRVLTGFLELNEGGIPPADEALVVSVLNKSWRVLELPGSFDLTDLPGSIKTLSERFSSKVQETKEQAS